jgi:hypothetical protein
MSVLTIQIFLDDTPHLLLNCRYICLFRTVIHNIQNRIKQATCFGLLNHHQTLTKNNKKTLNTAVVARYPPLVMYNTL